MNNIVSRLIQQITDDSLSAHKNIKLIFRVSFGSQTLALYHRSTFASVPKFFEFYSGENRLPDLEILKQLNFIKKSELHAFTFIQLVCNIFLVIPVYLR